MFYPDKRFLGSLEKKYCEAKAEVYLKTVFFVARFFCMRLVYHKRAWLHTGGVTNKNSWETIADFDHLPGKVDCVISLKTHTFSVSAERPVRNARRQQVSSCLWVVCVSFGCLTRCNLSQLKRSRTFLITYPFSVAVIKKYGSRLNILISPASKLSAMFRSPKRAPWSWQASLGYFEPHVTQRVCLTLMFIPMSKEKQDHSGQFHHHRPGMPICLPSPSRLRITLTCVIASYFRIVDNRSHLQRVTQRVT